MVVSGVLTAVRAASINVGAPAVPAALRAAQGEGAVAPELQAWLDEGEPPVFFGFGSMPVLDPSSAIGMITGVARRRVYLSWGIGHFGYGVHRISVFSRLSRN